MSAASGSWPIRALLAGILAAAISGAAPGANAAAVSPTSGVEATGSDVFTTPRETHLREKPSATSRTLGRLAQGTRLSLLETRGELLKVEGAGLPQGWIARGTAIVFAPGAGTTKDLLAVGRVFARNDGNRRLAAALLDRAAARLREAGTPDAEAEILAGETTETVAATGATAGIAVIEKTGSGKPPASAGASFERALELLARNPNRELIERATAGRLRARYPSVSTTLPALIDETSAWLQLVETAGSPTVLRPAAERAGAASLALGRYLLALGKTRDLGALSGRLLSVGSRLQTLLPEPADGRRLSARARIIAAMRGDGSASFPQEARVVLGPKERTVRIEGKLGALQLTVETAVGGTRDLQARRAAIPLLPVPGSLRVSPDGKFVAWIEVVGPAMLVPVMTSLERDEPAREIAFLSGGRPLRDQALAHVVTSLSGFSKDGQRLGFAIEAWNDAPGPEPRNCVVSVVTGELLFETSRDLKSFQRLLQ